MGKISCFWYVIEMVEIYLEMQRLDVKMMSHNFLVLYFGSRFNCTNLFQKPFGDSTDSMRGI